MRRVTQLIGPLAAMLDPEEMTDDKEAFPPLPPPDSPHQEDGGPFPDGEDGEASRLADVPAAKRKSVKRPQPKLDSQRLTSDRGLPALRSLFHNVCFKGRGHEAEDLQLLMQKMENWAHRLFPKLQFEEFIEKVEKLGSKKEVQTCLKRIRLDMPLAHGDFMDRDGDFMDRDGEQEVLQESRDPDPFSREGGVDGPVQSTPVLTEEQRRRMELNRERALERRLARRRQAESQTIDPSDGDEPTSVPAENVLHSPDKVEDLDTSISAEQNPSQPPTAHSELPPARFETPPPHSKATHPHSSTPSHHSEAPPAQV